MKSTLEMVFDLVILIFLVITLTFELYLDSLALDLDAIRNLFGHENGNRQTHTETKTQCRNYYSCHVTDMKKMG